jgi:hypothetical protein
MRTHQSLTRDRYFQGESKSPMGSPWNRVQRVEGEEMKRKLSLDRGGHGSVLKTDATSISYRSDWTSQTNRQIVQKWTTTSLEKI